MLSCAATEVTPQKRRRGGLPTPGSSEDSGYVSIGLERAVHGPGTNGSTTEQLIKACWSFSNPGLIRRLLDQTSKADSTSPRERSLLGCGAPILQLLFRLCTSARVQDSFVEYSHIVHRLDDLVIIAKEKCYAFPYKDVPFCWTELFRYASFLKATVLAMEGTWGATEYMLQQNANPILQHVEFPALKEKTLDGMVEAIDMALIMAGPPPDEGVQMNIDKILRLLERAHDDIISVPSRDDPSPSKRQRLDDARLPSLSLVPVVIHPVPVLNYLSMEAFERYMRNPKDKRVGPAPLVLKDTLKDWPAVEKWKQISYLKARTIGGRRLVPVEIGKNYVDSGWGQSIITFGKFLEDYVIDPTLLLGNSMGYLAQYNLFEHVPALREDILIPDLCYATCSPPHYSSPFASKHSQTPQLAEPMLNAWFGPAGTVSPMHTDPYHNILAQVVGRKYVRLYAPREHSKLYPRGIEEGGIDMSNTSRVDVGLMAGLDGNVEAQERAFEEFPLFRQAEYVEVILEPGDCLYIPLGWWHYVRSLSVSFSVSFWFNDTNDSCGEYSDES